MKTGTMVILILLMTGGALAIANKSCKTSPHPWCVRSLHSQHGQALTRAGKTRASVPQSTSTGSTAVSETPSAAKL
jgi:hypothetical protein